MSTIRHFRLGRRTCRFTVAGNPVPGNLATRPVARVPCCVYLESRHMHRNSKHRTYWGSYLFGDCRFRAKTILVRKPRSISDGWSPGRVLRWIGLGKGWVGLYYLRDIQASGGMS